MRICGWSSVTDSQWIESMQTLSLRSEGSYIHELFNSYPDSGLGSEVYIEKKQFHFQFQLKMFNFQYQFSHSEPA